MGYGEEAYGGGVESLVEGSVLTLDADLPALTADFEVEHEILELTLDADLLALTGDFNLSAVSSDVDFDADLPALRSAFTIASSRMKAVLDDGPELFLRLGESSGSSATDATGNGHTGVVALTPSGTPAWGHASLVVTDPGNTALNTSTSNPTTVTIPATGTPDEFTVEGVITLGQTGPVARRAGHWFVWMTFDAVDGFILKAGYGDASTQAPTGDPLGSCRVPTGLHTSVGNGETPIPFSFTFTQTEIRGRINATDPVVFTLLDTPDLSGASTSASIVLAGAVTFSPNTWAWKGTVDEFAYYESALTDAQTLTHQVLGYALHRDVSFASSIPALTGAFDENFTADLTLDASLPSLTGAFESWVQADVQLDANLPVLTGDFETGVYSPYVAATIDRGPLALWLLDEVRPEKPAVTWDPATMLGSDSLHPNNAGMTYLAGAIIDALEDAGKAPAPGDTLTAYGDSYTAADEQNSAGMRAIHQLRDHYSLTLTNRAVSGYRTGDCAAYALGASSGYTPGSSDYVYLMAGVNDLTYTDAAFIRTAAENNLRTWFATVSAAERIEDTAFTYSGTWTAQTGKESSAGTLHQTSTDGDSATYTIATPGDYFLLTQGVDPAAAFNGGQLTITQGATTLAVIDLDDVVTRTPYRLGDTGPLSVKLEGVVAGTLTVTFNTLGRTSARGWVDALLRVSATPPVIVAVKPLYVLQSAKQKPALLATIRNLYDQMAEEFANVVVVDADVNSDVKAKDSVGGHDGWYSRSVTLGVDGFPGVAAAAEFGAGSYVDIGDEFGFEGDKTFTFVAWVQLPTGWGSSNYAPIMTKGNIGPRLARYSNTGGIQWDIASGGTYAVNSSSPAINDGEWHQVVGRYNGDAATQPMRLNIDTASGGTNVVTRTPQQTTQPFRLGGNSGATSLVFPGRLAALAIYDTDLSDADVTEDYDLGTAELEAAVLTVDADLPALAGAFEVGVAATLTLNGNLPTLVTTFPTTVQLDSGVPALAGAFDLAIVAPAEVTLDSGVPSLTGAFGVAVEASLDFDAAALPALTGAFTMVGSEQVTIDASLPALVGDFALDTPLATQVNNRAGGRLRLGLGTVFWEPPVTDGPPTLGRVDHTRISAAAYGDVVMNGTQPVFDAVRAHTTRDRVRIVIGGHDVTYFRGVPTPEPTYMLIAPLMYGAASIVLPQVAVPFETPGQGELSWLKPGVKVLVQRVNDAGEVTATDYKGVVIRFDINPDPSGGHGLEVQVGGEASGRAALIDKQPPLFYKRNDLGFWWWGGIQDLGLRFEPRLGPDTGIVLRNAGGMSHLDYLNDLSAKGARRNGAQLTCMPDAHEAGGAYRVVTKDLTTVHATVYLDDSVSVPALNRDVAEEPNRVFATGVTPESMRVKFGAYPMLKDAAAPAYPFNDNRSFGVGTVDADTDTGDGVSVMIWRLVKAGFLPLADKPGGYDSDVADAIKDLKEDSSGDDPTFIDGTMNPDAWAALFDTSAANWSVAGTVILPAAQRRATRKWNRAENGSAISRNPSYDPSILLVDATTDFGVGVTRKQMRTWSRAEIRDGGEANWTGTITLRSGAVIAGTHNPGDALTADDLMDARALRPGMNVWCPQFDGGTLFHVSGVEKRAPDEVALTVDTQARDTMKVWEVIKRNRDSRRNPARAWLNQHRSSALTKDAIGEFDEVGGVIDDGVNLAGGHWTVFPVVAGQEGVIRSIRLETQAPTEFVCAVFGREVTPALLADRIGNPLTKHGKHRWVREDIRKELDEDFILLYTAGEKQAPCGYFPGTKFPDGAPDDTASGDDDTDAPDASFLTGKWQDDAGFSYHTFGSPALYVAVFAAEASRLTPGRIMWPQLESGA